MWCECNINTQRMLSKGFKSNSPEVAPEKIEVHKPKLLHLISLLDSEILIMSINSYMEFLNRMQSFEKDILCFFCRKASINKAWQKPFPT